MKKAGTISAKARRGASSVEYMLVLMLVVFPIALCTPLIMHMIAVYSARIVWVIRTPFG